MLYSKTDLESFITEYSLVYDQNDFWEIRRCGGLAHLAGVLGVSFPEAEVSRDVLVPVLHRESQSWESIPDMLEILFGTFSSGYEPWQLMT